MTKSLPEAVGTLAYVTANVFSTVIPQSTWLQGEPNSERDNEAIKIFNSVDTTCRCTGCPGGFFMEFR